MTNGTEAKQEITPATIEALNQLIGELGPLLSDDVDLSVLKTGHTTYTVPNVAGDRRTFKIPNDVPFPVAIEFLGAFDGYQAARGKVFEAQVAAEEAANARAQAHGNPTMLRRLDRQVELAKTNESAALKAFREAWIPVIEALLPLLRYHQPDTTLEEVLDNTGQTYLEQWVATIVMRMSRPRLLTFIEEAKKAAEAPKAPAAKAKSRRRTSSRSSAA